MDDNKVIPLMEAFFKAQAETVSENDEPAKKTLSFGLRKIMTKFLDWYEETRSAKDWQIGTDDYLKFPKFKPMPVTTGDKSLEKYEKAVIPILDDFNHRNISRLIVEEYFDGYIDRIKYGWKKRIEELSKK